MCFKVWNQFLMITGLQVFFHVKQCLRFCKLNPSSKLYERGSYREGSICIWDGAFWVHTQSFMSFHMKVWQLEMTSLKFTCNLIPVQLGMISFYKMTMLSHICRNYPQCVVQTARSLILFPVEQWFSKWVVLPPWGC